MTKPAVPPLTALSEEQRAQAQSRFTIIRPALEDGVTQAHIAHTSDISSSTVQRWVKRYRESGLAGLADRSVRSDKGGSGQPVCGDAPRSASCTKNSGGGTRASRNAATTQEVHQ